MTAATAGALAAPCAAQLAPAPTGAEIGAWSDLCLDVPPAAWPLVDALHDGWMEWISTSTLDGSAARAAQREYEIGTIRAIGALAECGASCVELVQLLCEESRLRGILARAGATPRIAMLSSIGIPPEVLRTPALLEAQRSVNAALERIATEVTSAAPLRQPRDLQPLSAAELSAAKALLAALAAVEATPSVMADPAAALEIRERAVLHMLDAGEDRYAERARAILANVRDIHPSAAARVWDELARFERARRDARAKFLEACTKSPAEARDLAESIRDATRSELDWSVIDPALPETARRTVRLLVRQWDNLADPEHDASEVLTEEGVRAVARFMPERLRSHWMPWARFRIVAPDDSDAILLELERWGIALDAETKRAALAALPAWRVGPAKETGEAMGRRLVPPPIPEGVPADVAQRNHQVHLELGDLDLIESIWRSESALLDALRALVPPSALTRLELWHQDRLEAAFIGLLFPRGDAYGLTPHPISPGRAILESRCLSDDERADLLSFAAAQAKEIAPLFREILLLRAIERARGLAEDLAVDANRTQSAVPELPSTLKSLLESPLARELAQGRPGPVATYNELLKRVEAQVAEIDRRAPAECAREVLTYWALDAFPVLRREADRVQLGGGGTRASGASGASGSSGAIGASGAPPAIGSLEGLSGVANRSLATVMREGAKFRFHTSGPHNVGLQMRSIRLLGAVAQGDLDTALARLGRSKAR